MAEINSFPNNQDEYIGAETVMRYLHGRTSGVFAAEDNCAVTPIQNTMKVNVSNGSGWLSNNNSDGIVWWIDEIEPIELEVEAASGAYNRVDRVVVTWETIDYVARPEVTILKGTETLSALSINIAPELTNNNAMRQISLARIEIPKGLTKLTPENIIDERFNPDVCGIVTESLKIDTSVVTEQFEILLDNLKKAIEQAEYGVVPDGSILNEKLANNAVTTEKIADNSVTTEKLASGILAKVFNFTYKSQSVAATTAAAFEATNSIPEGWYCVGINAVGTTMTNRVLVKSFNGSNGDVRLVNESGGTLNGTPILSVYIAQWNPEDN